MSHAEFIRHAAIAVGASNPNMDPMQIADRVIDIWTAVELLDEQLRDSRREQKASNKP